MREEDGQVSSLPHPGFLRSITVLALHCLPSFDFQFSVPEQKLPLVGFQTFCLCHHFDKLVVVDHTIFVFVCLLQQLCRNHFVDAQISECFRDL